MTVLLSRRNILKGSIALAAVAVAGVGKRPPSGLTLQLLDADGNPVRYNGYRPVELRRENFNAEGVYQKRVEFPVHLGGPECEAHGVSLDLNGKSILTGSLEWGLTITKNIVPMFSVGSLICHNDCRMDWSLYDT